MGMIKFDKKEEQEAFKEMYTIEKFKNWIKSKNLIFNEKNLKKYKDYCFNYVLNNTWNKKWFE